MALEFTTAYLLLGGNLGDRAANLHLAVTLLEKRAGEITAKSSLYETAAWGKTDQPAFLNQAVALKTPLSALDLLQTALDIEQELGRIRKERWGERLIDIDIVLFGNEIIDVTNKLHIPHPHMHNRKFVMRPLSEIAPNMVHPVLKQTIDQILENINDELEVIRL
ncbi:2-amino-4-hydroxy-6-hydroxymethyldihydropteridine diphosphokinase [Pedobacter sp. AW1-32]|uniref:2-amino-4-hydroxy-6- hydroxymethyldihydropteridine diphosphokinase n=1 Tax=Pedobacter sp. AW1-32 TaxID=3383026 RepID=UPI003FEE82CA